MNSPDTDFAARADAYRLPEKRRVRYVSIDANALRDTMTVTPVEVEARYRDNAATYSTPEQVRASHILLKTEGKDDATVKKAAEAVLEQARAQYKAQQVALAYTEIRAPFDGVVLNKNANLGDMVTPMSSAAGAQGAVVTMADMSTLEVEADVSEGNLVVEEKGLYSVEKFIIARRLMYWQVYLHKTVLAAEQMLIAPEGTGFVIA